jgi:sodium/potassium-transporting ATPase subunit alpha
VIGIITGDTVEDVARSAGEPVSKIHYKQATAEIIHGSQIPKLTKQDWDRICSRKELVFARY